MRIMYREHSSLLQKKLKQRLVMCYTINVIVSLYQRTDTPTMHIESLDYPLIQIPAGAFIMGTIPTGMRKTDPEEPQRSVQLDAYAIGAYQVTNAQYTQFLEATGYAPPELWNDERFNAPDFPVVGVSWYDATQFLEWLGTLENVAYRLPFGGGMGEGGAWDGCSGSIRGAMYGMRVVRIHRNRGISG